MAVAHSIVCRWLVGVFDALECLPAEVFAGRGVCRQLLFVALFLSNTAGPRSTARKNGAIHAYVCVPPALSRPHANCT